MSVWTERKTEPKPKWFLKPQNPLSIDHWPLTIHTFVTHFSFHFCSYFPLNNAHVPDLMMDQSQLIWCGPLYRFKMWYLYISFVWPAFSLHPYDVMLSKTIWIVIWSYQIRFWHRSVLWIHCKNNVFQTLDICSECLKTKGNNDEIKYQMSKCYCWIWSLICRFIAPLKPFPNWIVLMDSTEIRWTYEWNVLNESNSNQF